MVSVTRRPLGHQVFRSAGDSPCPCVIDQHHIAVIRIAVGADEEAAFPEQIDGFVAPHARGRVKGSDADALNHSLKNPAKRTKSLGECIVELCCGAPVVHRGAKSLEGAAQPEVCHAGAGVRAMDGIATRATGVTTAALRAIAGRAFALRGAAVAEEAVATAKPATTVTESAAAAKRRRAGVAAVEEVVMH